MAFRGSLAPLAATTNASVCGPLPVAPEGNVTQGESAAAVHEQADPVPSVTVPWPPVGENVSVALETL